ncbi:RNase H domain-containing protein [Trichonephila clavipes]|nr:RNase H domain-containing protein [Trichonephila clavipes]
MCLAGHPSQGCFGLQSHCAPRYFFNQASFYPSDFSFTKDGAAKRPRSSAPLTNSELHSTYSNNKQSTIPPAHHWYEAKRPLSLQCSRQEQTIITSFRSGHLQTLAFKDVNKVLPTCVRCSTCQHLQSTFLTDWGLQTRSL